MAEPAKEWYVIAGVPIEYPNLEAATIDARFRAAESDKAFDIFRMTSTPVRCVKREVSITETDIAAPREAVAE